MTAPPAVGSYLTVFGYDDDKEEMYSLDTYKLTLTAAGRVDSYGDIELAVAAV
ncbi:MAG: hypothetical protein H6668_19610 [Ardenticatenaceae bacterium]|nr:hypothetical protein [Ardenticatenaceae bacterium]